MKLSLVAINAKYVHTNLAVRSISGYLANRGVHCPFYEYTIAEETQRIGADLISKGHDGFAFSCYIWNWTKVLEVAELLKKAMPWCRILFGGPQVTYQPQKVLEQYAFVDGVLCGEGELAYEQLLKEGRVSSGFVDRNGGSGMGMKVPLEELPFPYTYQELQERGRIFYYETSRGCPFACSYCLSAAERGVRYKPLQQVFSELDRFLDAKVRLVKLIDRTFNSDNSRACEILRYLLKKGGETQFHFEVAADHLSEEAIALIRKFPKGRIRLEVGLQSCNEKTLEAVNRRCDLSRLEKNLKMLAEGCVVHLDLIAGLPYEHWESFQYSFDRAYRMGAEELQLGFLKVLSGAPIESQQKQYGYQYTSYPPYEVISNDFLSFSQLARLKELEAILDAYSNSGSFSGILTFLLERYSSPFQLFDEMAIYFKERGWLKNPHQKTTLFAFMKEFLCHKELWKRQTQMILAKDYLLACKGAPVPSWISQETQIISKKRLQEILMLPEIWENITETKKIDVKQRHKYIRIEKILNMVWIVAYLDKKIVDITQYF